MISRFIELFSGDGYQGRAFRGAALTFLSVGGQNVLRLASNLILTRLLFPEAFGLMALVQVVLAGANMLSDIGIRDSVIRDERGTERVFLNTAWTMQILRGFLLALVIVCLAGPLARFFDAPDLEALLLFGALMPAIQGFNSIRISSANRELLLGKITALMLGAQCAGIVSMVALAFWLESVWALAIGSVVGACVMALLSHFLPGDADRLGFDRDAFTRILRYGRYVFLATIATYFANQGDKLVLGKFVSLEMLAIYNIGFFLATAPLIFAFTLTARIIFPVYARRPPSQSAENRRKINKARMLVTAGLMGTTGVLALIGDPLIRFLYDPRYEGAGPFLVLIALASIPRIITLSYEKLPLASGDSRQYAVFTIGHAIVQFLLLIAGVSAYGVLGAILAPLLAWALSYPYLIYLARNHSGWDPRHDIIYLAVAAVFSVGVLWVYRDLLAAVAWL